MFTRFPLILYLLNLTLLIRVQCNNLYAYPKTVHVVDGTKVAVSCLNSFDDQSTALSKKIEWMKLNSLSVISSHPEARVRRHGRQLLFNSTSYSDGGFYCCRYSVENLGCTSSSTVRITVVARKARKLVTKTMGHSIAQLNGILYSHASPLRLV